MAIDAGHVHLLVCRGDLLLTTSGSLLLLTTTGAAASRVRDREDFYPLHLAAMNESGYAEAMVNELLRPGLNKECCSMEDRQGMLPVHLACRNHGSSAGAEHPLLLQLTAASGAMFHEMMRVYPEAVRHLDRSDMLPLHHACGNEAKSGLEMVVECLAAYPQGALSEDRQGMLPLHHAVTNMSPDGVSLCLEVLSKAPSAVRHQDREGRTPLHYACLSVDPYDIVDMLLREYPEGANVADINGMLPLHWAAKNEHAEAKDLVDQLMCVNLDGKVPALIRCSDQCVYRC